MTDKIRRVNYFTGQLLTTADFQDEQEYFRQKMKRHNRFLHGSGVVYGLELSLLNDSVIVQPGLALDCAGNEILLPVKQAVGLPAVARQLYVVVSYLEYGDAMVPVVGAPPDTGEETMQPSRIFESFELNFVDKLPECSLPAGEGQPLTCGEAHPVALGQVIRLRDGWQLNAAFRRKAISHPAQS